MHDIEQKLLGFLRTIIDPELELDTKLVESGMLDSFHVVELLSFVEGQFDVRIEPMDLTQADLETAANMSAFVARLVAAGPKAPEAEPAAET